MTKELELAHSSDMITSLGSHGDLASLLDSFSQVTQQNLELESGFVNRDHDQQEACKVECKQNKGTQTEEQVACSLTACRPTKQQARQEKVQLDQANLHKGHLGHDLGKEKLEQEEAKQTIGIQNSLGANNLGTRGFEANNLGTIGNKSIRTISFQKILIDTGAELSVAPKDFAAMIQLSPAKNDLELRAADGRRIKIFGVKQVQLLTPGFSFSMSFVIADVSQALIGMGSLMNSNLCMQLNKSLGHPLGNMAGEKIQLEQWGLQLYLSACPVPLELPPCIRGSLLEESLLPEANLVPKAKRQLRKEDSNSGTLRQHKQQRNTSAIGQQAWQTARKKQNNIGQTNASKLELEKTNFQEQVQLALLESIDPRGSLDHDTAREISFRIFLTFSLMQKWQLKITRVQTALPQELLLGQLRKLGMRESKIDSHILVGDQLCVFLHGDAWMTGGEPKRLEAFFHRLSESFPLTTTQQLEHKTPLIFMGKILELDQADRTISLTLPKAFFSTLLGRYSLEEATTRSSPTNELDNASRWQNPILDASRIKLYKQTVADLIWSSNLRPDTSFVVQQLAQSSMQPTEQDEAKLRSLLQYLKGTQQLGVTLGVPRKWVRATELELLAFTTSWNTTCHSTLGVCLSFLGVPLAASMASQATTSRTAAELSSVRLASIIAFLTRSLLSDLGLDKPLALRVLTGGPLAKKLGLSKKTRHIQLWSRFGQFKLSKVQPRANLAEQLANIQQACALHRLLPKLRMHTQAAETGALPTVLAGETASVSSSSSFYIGVLTKHPAQLDLSKLEQHAMEELGLEKLEQTVSKQLTLTAYARQLDQDELELSATSLQPESSLTVDKLETSKMNPENLSERSLRENELQEEPLASQPDEGRIALAASGRAFSEEQLQGEELVNILAFPLLDSKHEALEQSASENSSSTTLGIFPSLSRVFVILTAISLTLFSLSLLSSFSSLTCQSLSFQMSSYSLNCTSLSFQSIFPNGWAEELAELHDIALHNELSTTFGESELENKAKLGRTCWEEESEKTLELQNLLWDQELAKFIAHKTCPLDLSDDHLGQELLCENQLRQNNLEDRE